MNYWNPVVCSRGRYEEKIIPESTWNTRKRPNRLPFWEASFLEREEEFGAIGPDFRLFAAQKDRVLFLGTIAAFAMLIAGGEDQSGLRGQPANAISGIAGRKCPSANSAA